MGTTRGRGSAMAEWEMSLAVDEGIGSSVSLNTLECPIDMHFYREGRTFIAVGLVVD